MTITLKLFASLAAHLPAEARLSHGVELDVAGDDGAGRDPAPGRSGSPLLDRADRRPVCGPGGRATRTLENGEVLAIWPPIAGG